MCGFAGLYLLDHSGAPAVLRARTDAMCQTSAHRGPDDSTALVLPFAAVGFRRLSIVDLHARFDPANRPVVLKS